MKLSVGAARNTEATCGRSQKNEQRAVSSSPSVVAQRDAGWKPYGPDSVPHALLESNLIHTATCLRFPIRSSVPPLSLFLSVDTTVIMSATSLPSYIAPSFVRSPSYTAEPQEHEQRLALSRLRRRPSSDFVKHSRGGGISLRLTEQPDGAALPVYGRGDAVEGTVELAKPEGVVSVEVKIEGSLKLKEVAEGGTASHKLCLSTMSWTKDDFQGPFPSTIPFSLTLPSTFSDGREEYPLPPTHESHLSGMPGFTATIGYVVSVTVVKDNKLSLLSRLGTSTVSTPFMYYPRSRPAMPLPVMFVTRHALGSASPSNVPDWECFKSVMVAKTHGGKDIISRLYVPASRVFCMTQPIPFQVTFSSSAFSLAAFMPFGPNASYISDKRPTRMQLIRQTTVDVRNAIILGTKTDIWRTEIIGEGVFRHAGDGPDWISYSGEVAVSSDVKICGFKAGGFSVKDYIVLTMTPPDPAKAPFRDLRQIVPVRLTTDPWDVSMEYSDPILPEDAYPELRFAD